MTEESIDHLIVRVRERASDPALRTEQRPSQFLTDVRSAPVADLMALSRSLSAQLARLVTDGPDADTRATVDGFQQAMGTPADRPLPPQATQQQVDAAERAMGVTIPPLLRRLYLEVANGGFGPGPGIVGVRGGATTDHGQSVEDLHDEVLDATTENEQWIWPRSLVPVADLDGMYACVDCTTAAGRVIEFDFEALDDDEPDGGWTKAFSERAQSLAEWLEPWLDSGSAPAQPTVVVGPPSAIDMAIPEVTRQYWASMTPAERAGFGLPETGWGRALFGEAWGDDPRDGSSSAGLA